MKTDKKADFQKEFDLKKWDESAAAGHDKCGEYDFCAVCDKTLANPCAEANFKKEGEAKKAAPAAKAPAKKATAPAAKAPAKKTAAAAKPAKK